LKKPEPDEIGGILEKRHKRWQASLMARRSARRASLTHPVTPPMESRRLAQAAKRKLQAEARMEVKLAMETRRKEDGNRRLVRFIAKQEGDRRRVAETSASRRKAE
ncbi:unnamed protein product, partial [Sphacelaria rigidula]